MVSLFWKWSPSRHAGIDHLSSSPHRQQKSGGAFLLAAGWKYRFCNMFFLLDSEKKRTSLMSRANTCRGQGDSGIYAQFFRFAMVWLAAIICRWFLKTSESVFHADRPLLAVCETAASWRQLLGTSWRLGRWCSCGEMASRVHGHYRTLSQHPFSVQMLFLIMWIRCACSAPKAKNTAIAAGGRFRQRLHVRISSSKRRK